MTCRGKASSTGLVEHLLGKANMDVHVDFTNDIAKKPKNN
jgi:hypothetical protein